MNALRMGELFAGYGGLGLGVAQVLDVELAWVSEWEPPTEKNPRPSQAAARILDHRYPGVPNHLDITAIDWSAVEPVDVLTAGYPCQPFSTAGKRLGEADERYLWPEVERAIRHLGPRIVVLENVAGHLNRGFPEVLGSLATCGYNARWTCLQAAHVGAPHRRERLFVVAWPAADPGGEAVGFGPRLRSGVPTGFGWRRPDDDAAPAAADADGDTVREQSVAIAGRGGASQSRGAGADGGGLRTHERELWPGQSDVAWGPYEPAIRRWERVLGRVAPPPTEPSRTGAERLSPRFVEWMQGLPAGHVTDVPGISRNDMLKALGNGVVPQQAAEAVRRLLAVPARRGVAA